MRIVVVGAGRWGSKLIQKFDALLGVGNVYIVEQDASKWHNWEPAGGLRCFPDLDLALRTIPGADAIVVATQPRSHAEIAARALWAGKHVLVEKPLCMDGGTARQLLGLAKERGLTLMTDDTHQYHPDMAPFIEGAKGTTSLFASWCNAKVSQAEDSILWVNGPHPLSIAIGAMGMPETIEAKLAQDDADVTLHWVNGRWAMLRLTWRGNFSGVRTRLAMAGPGPSGTFDGDAPCSPDPLDRMCAAFIRRCGAEAPWQDERGVQVVEVLEAIEKATR